ncbi:hypothetical protein J6590_091937 [Homalodisca vitripennis]|nr:hypothetical protein J6590_091937 [Homalodisca vitripennis]
MEICPLRQPSVSECGDAKHSTGRGYESRCLRSWLRHKSSRDMNGRPPPLSYVACSTSKLVLLGLRGAWASPRTSGKGRKISFEMAPKFELKLREREEWCLPKPRFTHFANLLQVDTEQVTLPRCGEAV